MEIVYCKNCKYHYCNLRVDGYTPAPHHICSANSKGSYDAIGDLKIKDLADCEVQNRYNDCSAYKRKWYKFWIKE